MTYQEIIDDIRNSTLTFISEKSEHHGIDASFIMQIMTEVVAEINYNNIMKALQEQRIVVNNLTTQLQTLQVDQPSRDE